MCKSPFCFLQNPKIHLSIQLDNPTYGIVVEIMPFPLGFLYPVTLSKKIFGRETKSDIHELCLELGTEKWLLLLRAADSYTMGLDGITQDLFTQV